MKNILYSAAIALIAITTTSNQVSFASPALTLGNCGYECLQEVKEPQPDLLANEVISLVQKSFEQNFSTNIDFFIDINGENFDWKDNKTTYSISYNVDDASITKNKNAYHIINNNQKFSISVDGIESYLPLEIDATFSDEEILDFDTFQFAGKFSINTLNTHDNDSVRHIVEGIMEFVELFENKWIVLDVVEIENEFPEIIEYIQTMKEDFDEESDINGYAELKWAFTSALENGYATIEKKGTTYIISFLPEIGDEIVISKTHPLQIILSTKNNAITNIAIEGSFDYKNSWDNDNASINISSNIAMSYKTIPITFPEISANDWEITNIIEMFLEFTKEDIIQKSKEREKFENLNSFTGNASDAIEFLNKNGTENDIIFVREFITNAKKLNRRIRLQDLRLTVEYYDIEDSRIQYLARDLAYSPYKPEDEYVYSYKDGFETLMSGFQEDSNLEYIYIPWDIYDTMNYQLKTRGDILITLAKVRKAELMLNK